MSFCRDWHVNQNNKDCRNPKISDEHSEMFEKLIEALQIIKNESGERGKIKCPVCGNDLNWTRASSNKHVWGKCKTDGCLSWMQ